MADAPERRVNSEYTGTFDVEIRAVVRITVTDPDVIRRPVENIDGWRESLYDLRTRNDVLAHLAFNAVYNGRENGLMLDGWADLPEAAVTMELSRREVAFDEIRVAP